MSPEFSDEVFDRVFGLGYFVDDVKILIKLLFTDGTEVSNKMDH